MTKLQVVGVQSPAGRQHAHVRVFCYRVADLKKTIVEVAVTVDEAVALIASANVHKEFPQIEVSDNEWAFCLNLCALQMVHIQHKEPSA